MTVNFPGPYEVRIIYTCDASPGGPLEHQVRFSCFLDGDPDPGDSFDDIQIKHASGGTSTLGIVVDALVDVIAPIMSADDTTIDYAELWKYGEGTFQATFFNSYTIAEPGTNVGAARAGAENIYTFRTRAGGVMRVHLLDHPGNWGPPVAYANLDPAHKNLCDFLTDPEQAAFVGRDGSYPLVALKVFPGQNEHLFKVRYGR
jgi:hypothetical protein